jgi:hypothetical protein
LSIETTVLTAGIVAEALVVALLCWRRVYRELPLFSAYLAWGLLGDSLMPLLQTHCSAAVYIRFYLGESSLDSLLQYGVLVELAWAVLRPFHAMPPRRVLSVTALGVLLAGALAWPLSIAPESVGLRWEYVLILRLEETFAIVRVVFFLALAVACHWLAVGWRNRELQVATGLGTYSLLSLAGSLVHRYQSVTSPAYHWVEVAIAASYVGSLVYWAVSFAQKEPSRPDLPEHAQNILLELAETAHGQRVALAMGPRGARSGKLE